MTQTTTRDSAASALAGLARELYGRGWCSGTSGNFSLVLEREPLRLLITQTGREKQALSGADFVAVGPDASPVAGETGRPSAETRLHVAIAQRAGAGCILHSHSVAGTLVGEHFRDKGGFTISGYEMLKGIEGVRSHEAAVFVPVLANDQDMEAVAERLQRRFDGQPGLRGFLLAGHGLYTWGHGLAQARRHLEIFEFLLELVLRRSQLAPFVG